MCSPVGLAARDRTVKDSDNHVNSVVSGPESRIPSPPGDRLLLAYRFVAPQQSTNPRSLTKDHSQGIGSRSGATQSDSSDFSPPTRRYRLIASIVPIGEVASRPSSRPARKPSSSESDGAPKPAVPSSTITRSRCVACASHQELWRIIDLTFRTGHPIERSRHGRFARVLDRCPHVGSRGDLEAIRKADSCLEFP